MRGPALALLSIDPHYCMEPRLHLAGIPRYKSSCSQCSCLLPQEAQGTLAGWQQDELCTTVAAHDWNQLLLMSVQVLPSREAIDEVERIARSFWSEQPDQYIAIHCAYGERRFSRCCCAGGSWARPGVVGRWQRVNAHSCY